MKNFKTYRKFITEAYSDEERKELADKGFALSDGSFPIKDLKDLKNAIQAYGRAKDQARAAKFIVKRAKALGAEDLIPDTEDFQKSLSESVNEGKEDPVLNNQGEVFTEKDLDDLSWNVSQEMHAFQRMFPEGKAYNEYAKIMDSYFKSVRALKKKYKKEIPTFRRFRTDPLRFQNHSNRTR